MPEIASLAKVTKIKAYGAEAIIGGAAYAVAQERCDAYVAESGALLIHPYDAVETIAGQGTVALEWEEDLERLGLQKLDTVLVAVGGGGLIAGVAAWFQGRVKVVGVEPEGSRAFYAALEADKPVDVTVQSLAADSLGAKRVGDLNFDIAKSFVRGVVLVEDRAIGEAQRRLWRISRSLPSQAGRRPSPPSRTALTGQSLMNGSAFWSAALMSISIHSHLARAVQRLFHERKIAGPARQRRGPAI